MILDLIFTNGNKLYEKNSSFLKSIVKMANLKPYQETLLYEVIRNNEAGYKIYGDGFKIEILPQNIRGECVLSVTDYDEHQKLESKIIINFSKEELSQVINLLHIIESKI